MYIKAGIIALIFWFIGLIIDVNVDLISSEPGFLYLRIVFPIIVIGILIIKAIEDKKKDK